MNALPEGGQSGSGLGPWRIAFCTPQFQPLHQIRTGELTHAADIQQASIAHALQQRGHRLTFLAPRSLFDIICTTDTSMPLAAGLGWSGTAAFTLLSKVTWRMQRTLGVPYLNVFSNYRLLDASLHCLPGHDIVHERNSLYRVGIAMACRRLRLPYVLFFDADQLLEQDFAGRPITGILRWRAKQMMRYTLRAADGIICVSRHAKSHLTRTYHVPAHKIAVLANAVDVRRFRPQPEVAREVRRALGIGEAPLLVFIGAFYPWHDVRTLLTAFAQVRVRHPGARLLLVGEGEHRDSMQRLAAELGLQGAAQFPGRVPHDSVARYIAAADIAVAPFIPRQYDLCGSPTKVFEYLACGAAIVASAVGQVSEVVRDGVNGLLVPPQDAAALASAIDTLIRDPALRARLGQAAREHAVSRHSWDRYVAELERVYGAVLAGRAAEEALAHE